MKRPKLKSRKIIGNYLLFCGVIALIIGLVAPFVGFNVPSLQLSSGVYDTIPSGTMDAPTELPRGFSEYVLLIAFYKPHEVGRVYCDIVDIPQRQSTIRVELPWVQVLTMVLYQSDYWTVPSVEGQVYEFNFYYEGELVAITYGIVSTQATDGGGITIPSIEPRLFVNILTVLGTVCVAFGFVIRKKVGS